MATCLITVSGTYGEVLFNYTDVGSVAHSIVSGPGEFYLDDDGSDYTYTVVYGDLTVSSGCITLTNLSLKCYLIYWQDVYPYQLLKEFDIQSIIVGDTEYSLYEELQKVSNTLSSVSVGNITNAINNLGYPLITSPAYKQPYYLIIRTLDGTTPYLKLSQKTSFYNIYLKGTEVTDCIPTDYTEVNIWPVIPVTTTSTTTTTTTYLP
jgi:hypothetical protein